MKNFVSRISKTALAGTMAFTLFGCSSSKTAGGTTGEKQTDFTIMGAQSPLSPGYADNEVLNKLAKDAGVNITWNTMSDSVQEQVNIKLASGDLPDAFSGVGFSNYDLTNYGGDGDLIDLTPYINADTMPNLTKIIEDNPNIKTAITMNDGKIYGLPSGEQMGTAGIGKTEDYSIFSIPQYSMINKKWLDALGLAVPTTLDELHTALQAFKDNDMAAKEYGAPAGSTLPMSTGFDQWCWGQNIFYAGFGFTNWINDVCDDLVLDNTGKVHYTSVTQNYRDALTYFHNWYVEGLMDQEMFSQDTTQLMSKCQQGYVGVSTWWYIEELMGKYASDYVFLPILTGPSGTAYEGKSNVNLRTGGATNSGNLSITSACKDPETLLKYFDQWYTGENVMQLQYGPIGTYFTQQDANGVWESITDAEAKEKYGTSAGELKSKNEVAGPKLILNSYYGKYFKMEDRAVTRLTDLYDYWMPFVKDKSAYPMDCVYTSDELDTIDKYKVDFQNAVAEQEGLWIRDGGITDDTWKAYVDKLTNSCGMDKLLTVYQDAYDRYTSKN